MVRPRLAAVALAAAAPAFAAVLAAVLLSAVPAAAAPVARAAVPQAVVRVPQADVHGDDEADRYVGSGGLILPPSFPEPTRRTVAGCPDCSWRMTTPCLEADLGTPFPGQAACATVTRGCPGGHLLRVWFRGRGAPWEAIGLACIGPAGPVTVASAAAEVRDEVARAVPPLRPSAQPAAGAVTQLPVVFGTGQRPGVHRWDMAVPGAVLVVQAVPRWSWAFGDGAALRTADAGGAYPHLGVTHAYGRGGRHEVTVTAEWTASFTAAGLGPFPVAGTIRQEGRLDVPVGEGRAVLVPPSLHGGAPMAQ